MFEQGFDAFFESVLFEALGHDVQVQEYHLLGGGNINQAVRLDTSEGYFFLKWNAGNFPDMFQAEAASLQYLKHHSSITIPQVIHQGVNAGTNFLLLEFINGYRRQPNFWQVFAQGLAGLHRVTQPSFGLHFDNYIGSLPQANTLTSQGINFYIEQRLKVQAGLALYEGNMSPRLHEQFNRLYERLPGLLPEEAPALLHGDLWGGNFITGNQGEPVLIDPAVYYGLREAEIAFTRLFGGFDEAFYAAYHEAWPLQPGFPQRMELYNLYPLLVHLNLFGDSYLPAIERVLKRYI